MKTKMLGAGMMAAMLAFVGVSACAEEAAQAAPAASAKAAVAARPGRVQITPEKRAEMRAKREQFMAARKAAMQAKMLEVVKKYVPDEEKAKALLAELEAVLMPSRRVRAERKPAEKKDRVNF